MNYNINITNARKQLYKLTEMVIKEGAVVNIYTKDGDAVLIGAKEYSALLETLYLSQNPEIKKSITNAMKEPLEEGTDLDNIKW